MPTPRIKGKHSSRLANKFPMISAHLSRLQQAVNWQPGKKAYRQPFTKPCARLPGMNCLPVAIALNPVQPATLVKTHLERLLRHFKDKSAPDALGQLTTFYHKAKLGIEYRRARIEVERADINLLAVNS